MGHAPQRKDGDQNYDIVVFSLLVVFWEENRHNVAEGGCVGWRGRGMIASIKGIVRAFLECKQSLLWPLLWKKITDHFLRVFSPFESKCDKYTISPWKISTWSNIQVMGIKKLITKVNLHALMFKDLILPGPRLYRSLFLRQSALGRHVIDLFIKTVSTFGPTIVPPNLSNHAGSAWKRLRHCRRNGKLYVESLVQTFGRHPETTNSKPVGTPYSTFVLTFARAFVERANVETV